MDTNHLFMELINIFYQDLQKKCNKKEKLTFCPHFFLLPLVFLQLHLKSLHPLYNTIKTNKSRENKTKHSISYN